MKKEKKVNKTKEEAKKEVQTEEEAKKQVKTEEKDVELTDEELSQVSGGKVMLL